MTVVCLAMSYIAMKTNFCCNVAIEKKKKKCNKAGFNLNKVDF